MLRRTAVLLLLPLAAALAGCSHSPETVVHFSAPSPGAWTVRDHTGARLCALPCRVDLEENDSVLRAFSDALVLAGGALIDERPDDDHARSGHGRRNRHLAAGIVLTGLGTAPRSVPLARSSHPDGMPHGTAGL